MVCPVYPSMDTVNILSINWKKIIFYCYYSFRKGQVMVGNYSNVFRLVRRVVILVFLSIIVFDFLSICICNQPRPGLFSYTQIEVLDPPLLHISKFTERIFFLCFLLQKQFVYNSIHLLYTYLLPWCQPQVSMSIGSCQPM